MVLKNLVLLTSVALLFGACGDGAAEIKKRDQQEAKLEPMNTEEARDLYVRNCESCHGIDGKKQLSGAADLSVSTKTDSEILHIIQNGNDKGMMPYKDLLTKREQSGLVEFVKTLR
ncbi:MAG: cytochrome c [Fluviicola sp.]|nr:cytochrome c [Fluviicola sp.]